MDDSKYRKLMILFIVLFVLALGAGGYFGYKYYQLYKKLNLNSLLKSTNTVETQGLYGKILNITDTDISIGFSDIDQKVFKFADNLSIQKLSQIDGVNVQYVDGTKSDLTVDSTIWFKTNTTGQIIQIKTTSLTISGTFPSPSPSSSQ